MTATEERTLKSAVMQLHVNTGHPSNESLARAIRITNVQSRLPPTSTARCALHISAHYLTYPDVSGWTEASTTPLAWTSLC